MAINKKLINFSKKEHFTSQLQSKNILDNSICFIDDTKELYTHKTLFGCANIQETKVTFHNGVEEFKIAEFEINNIELDPEYWTGSGILINSTNFPNGNGTYLIQITKGNSIYSGVVPIFIATDNSKDSITTSDEIVLSKMGHDNNVLYLKLDKNNTYIFGELYFSSLIKELTNLEIKIKKLI